MGPGLRALVGLALVLGLGGPAFSTVEQGPPKLQVWVRGSSGPGDSPLAVGSIQKPFVAKAWAEAHPGELPPRLRCGPGSHCWLHVGHGDLDLATALAVSCNAYFRTLAEATPLPLLATTLQAEGFSNNKLTQDSAIGLPAVGGLLTIRPSALLEAYVRLVKVPWPVGESVRQQVLAGLREAALNGTASLAQRGYWAKTGTVPIEGDPAHTQGFVIAVDDTGWAILGFLSRGTGSGAAAALGEPLKQLRPWNASRQTTKRGPAPTRSFVPPPKTKTDGGVAPEVQRVRVRMLDLLRSSRFTVRNVGPNPIPTGKGYLGNGGTLELHPGDRVGPGLLEIQAPGAGLRRRFEGELYCGQGAGKALILTATLALREYANGILAAELPSAASDRRIELGAAVLRFLDQNHRHPDADVCDSTHCAWFVGRGPHPSWDNPASAQLLPNEDFKALTAAEWTSILESARQPGPSQWTSHCGGTPLSPHRLWGFGDLEAPPCPRHGAGLKGANTRPWVRVWRTSEVEKAFGPSTRQLDIGDEKGTWVLKVSGATSIRSLRYDEAHRALAAVLGWGALPSPADHIEPIPGGFRATGVGLGHRVGLCLGD